MLATIPPIKTPLGQQELRRRTAGLGQRHRTLLFLIDGRRPLSEVLVLGHKAGAATSHLEDLIRLGFVDVPALHPAPQPAPVEVPEPELPAVVTYVEMEIPAGPIRSQWGSLDADVPVPMVKVLKDPPKIEVSPTPSDDEASERVVTRAWEPQAPPLAEPGPPPQALQPSVDRAGAEPQPGEPERSDSESEPREGRPSSLMPLEFPPEQAFTSIPEPMDAAAPAPMSGPVPIAPIAAPARAAPALAQPVPVAPLPRPLPPILQRMTLMGRRSAPRPKDPLDEARECLLSVIKVDRTTLSRRLRPRVLNAKTEGTLIDVVWELERDLTHGQRSHEGLISLQRARELLQLGNTLVDEEDESGMLAG
jgi:hypothetical protein